MIRVFQFKNNFLSENPGMLKAEYSVIGYFDGLDMKTDAGMEGMEKSRILSDPFQYEFIKNDPYEMCDYFNIAGLREQSDEDFWKSSEEPLVFISCIRFKRKSEKLKELIEMIEETYHAVCFTTLDSSDLVICLKTTSHEKGYRAIEEYRRIISECDPQNGLQKGFSVLAIQQHVLDSLRDSRAVGIEEEQLQCVLRGVIRDWSGIDPFLKELGSELKVDMTSNCAVYGLLGSEDITITLKNIRSIDWFRLYANKGLMTHVHPQYRAAFYNIRTEILEELKTGEIK